MLRPPPPSPPFGLSKPHRVCVDCVVCAESYILLQVVIVLSFQVEMLEEIVSQKGTCMYMYMYMYAVFLLVYLKQGGPPGFILQRDNLHIVQRSACTVRRATVSLLQDFTSTSLHRVFYYMHTIHVDYGGSGICAVRPARLLTSLQLPPLVLVVVQQLQKLKSLLHLLLRRQNTGIAALIHCGVMNFSGFAISKTAHVCAFGFLWATLFKLSFSENAV